MIYVSGGFFFPRRSLRPSSPSPLVPLATLGVLFCLPLAMLVTSGSAIMTLVPELFLRPVALAAPAPLVIGTLSAESEEGGKEEELECLGEGRGDSAGEEYMER